MAIYFPGNSNYELLPSVGVSGTSIWATASVRKNSGSGFWTATPQLSQIRISSSNHELYWTYDFRSSTPQTVFVQSHSAAVGYGTFQVQIWVNMDSGIGQAYYSQTVTISNPATAPGTPAAPTLSQITATGVRVAWSAPSNGGSAITGYDVQRGTSAAFANAVAVSDNASPNFATDLTPGTTYWWRVRAKNAIGNGAWSASTSATTRTRVHRGVGGSLVEAQVYRGKGGAFVDAEVYVGRGGVFVPAT